MRGLYETSKGVYVVPPHGGELVKRTLSFYERRQLNIIWRADERDGFTSSGSLLIIDLLVRSSDRSGFFNLHRKLQLWSERRACAGLRPRREDSLRGGYKGSPRRPKCRRVSRKVPSSELRAKGSREYLQNRTMPAARPALLSPIRNPPTSPPLLWLYSPAANSPAENRSLKALEC